MKKLLKVLKKAKNISAWKVNVSETESCELFYVKQKLETNRATNVVDYLVTIYIDENDQRGSSSFTYYPYMSEEEIEEAIKEAVFASKFTLNQFFDIPSPSDLKIEKSQSNLRKKSFDKLIKNVSEAVFKYDKFKDGYLSATEIFLYKITQHIYNSKGVKIAFTTYRGNIETIPSWKKKDDEVELYNMIKFSSLDKKDIAKQIKEALLLSKARAKARTLKPKKLPEGIKVIIQDEEVEQVFEEIAYQLNYQAIYQKMNLFNIGDNVQGDNVTGDKLNLKVVPYYENAMNSSPVDNDGVVLKEVELIKDGVAKNSFGSYQYGYYLGIKNPTGSVPVMVVKEGEKPFEEMKKTPYIRCVRFSGMQLDIPSGFIGGEVRLAFYFDGKKEVPVTGFSISGNFHALKGSFVFSKETATRPSYHGPKYIEIKGMEIV